MSKINGGLRRGATAFVLSILTIFTVACGGSGDAPVVQPATAQNVLQTFSGAYLGSNDLGDNQFANLNFAVDNSSQAVVTLGITQLLAQTVQPGLYTLSGDVDPGSGNYVITTDDPVLGVITVSGTLPRGNTQANYQLAIRGQLFTGVIQPAALGLPAIVNGGGNAQLLAGGANGVTTFTPDAAFNGDLVQSSSNLTGVSGAGLNGLDTITVVSTIVETPGAQPRVRNLSISAIAVQAATLQVGQTLVFNNALATGAKLTLVEFDGIVPVQAWAAGAGSTGQVTVVKRDATGVQLDYQFTNVGPDPSIPNNGALGTFNITGSAAVPFQ